MADGACMPKFSGEAVRAVEDLAIDDDSDEDAESLSDFIADE